MNRSKWQSLFTPALRLLGRGIRLGFFGGALEGLWEILAGNLLKSPLMPPFVARDAWVQVMLFSGTVWAVAGAGLALAVILFRCLQRRAASGRDSSFVQSFILVACFGLAYRQGIVLIYGFRQPSLSLGWWVLSLSSGGVGGLIVTGLLNLKRKFEKRFRTIQRLSLWAVRIGFAGLCLGWVALVAQRASWHIDGFWKPAPALNAPNVLIMAVDSLRADHVSLYGYSKTTTPSIDQFFHQGAIAFRDCQSAATWTRPAVASIVTGHLYPLSDEIQIFETRFGRLPSGTDTLLRRFHRAGYATGWFSADPWASTSSNLAADADRLVMPRHSHIGYPIAVCQEIASGVEKWPKLYAWTTKLAYITDGTWYRPNWLKDEELSKAFMAWPAHGKGRPWVAYMHFMQVHYPYGSVRGQHLVPDEQRKTFPPDQDHGTDPQTMKPYLDAYDADIPYTDGCIGKILDDLRRRGELDHTVVIITADHGEEFGEHGAMGHGTGFHREVTHVPLLLFAPTLKGPRWVNTPVHQTDLLPTVLGLAGLPGKSELEGRDLVPLITGPLNTDRRSFLMCGSYKGTAVRAIRRGPYQLYQWALFGRSFSALYNLEEDPHERIDISRKRPDLLAPLQTDFLNWQSVHKREEPPSRPQDVKVPEI